MVTRSSEVAEKSKEVGSTVTDSISNKLLNHICDFQPDGMDGPETAAFRAFLAALFSVVYSVLSAASCCTGCKLMSA